MRPPASRWWAALATVALAGSCQGPTAPASSGAALPKAPPTVVVTMREYRFDVSPAVPAGRVVFVMGNAGRVDHRPILVALPEDMAPIAEQVAGPDRRVLSPFAGVPTRRPGQSGVFAVELVAGTRYAFLCFLPDAQGKLHALRGMATEFRAGAPDLPGRRSGRGRG